MENLLSLLHFFNFITYLILAIFILLRNEKALISRVCSALMLCFGIWSFGKIFVHNPLTPLGIARLSENIASFGWASFSSFFLWFVVIFTQKKTVLKSKPFYVLIALLPPVFVYKQWTNQLLIDHAKQFYGWGNVWAESIWPNLFYLYYGCFMLAALYLLFTCSRVTYNSLKQKQAWAIFSGTIIAVTIGSLSDVIFPQLNIRPIPEIADSAALFWAFGLVYAIEKYKFLTITPSTAAENIIATMADALFLLNTQGNIVTVNAATERLLGYTKKELIGKTAKLFIEPEEYKKVLSVDIIACGGMKNQETRFKTRAGKAVEVNFSSSILKTEAGNLSGIVCMANDITERKQAETLLRKAYDGVEQKVQKRTVELVELNEILHKEIETRKFVEQKLTGSEKQFRTLVSNIPGAVFRCSAGPERVIEFITDAIQDISGYPASDFFYNSRRSYSSIIHSEDRAMVANSILKEIQKKKPYAVEYRIIHSDGKMRWVYENGQGLFDKDKELLWVNGAILNITERKTLAEKVKQNLERLKRILEETVEALVVALEKRDSYTAGHQLRVSHLAYAIAKDMGLDEDQLEGVRLAGMLHDIGKIYIPDAILNKLGRLTDEEFDIIKKHPGFAYDILKVIEFPWPLAQAVFQHHERMNGSGYPRGLAGEDILMEAKILAVADVVEAMASKRPYRPALGIDVALEEISGKRGKLYDMEVADTCRKLFTEKRFKLE